MLAILEFIFSSFWVWLGTLFLIGTVGWALHRIFLGLRGVPAPDSEWSSKN